MGASSFLPGVQIFTPLNQRKISRKTSLAFKKGYGERKLNVHMKAAGLKESEKAGWCLCEECWEVEPDASDSKSIIFNYSSVTPPTLPTLPSSLSLSFSHTHLQQLQPSGHNPLLSLCPCLLDHFRRNCCTSLDTQATSSFTTAMHTNLDSILYVQVGGPCTHLDCLLDVNTDMLSAGIGSCNPLRISG